MALLWSKGRGKPCSYKTYQSGLTVVVPLADARSGLLSNPSH
ncbi:hypothetical protein [Marinicella rhabdoformis]|nr:hypothetical protein [Marinicella rhabdoformis]